MNPPDMPLSKVRYNASGNGGGIEDINSENLIQLSDGIPTVLCIYLNSL